MDNSHDASGSTPVLRLQRLDADLPLPVRAHPTDAGIDLHAAHDCNLAPGHRMLVGTGVAIALPAGFVGLVHPRSGLAARVGLSIVNAPGTVDAAYRGEIKVNLINLDPTDTVHIARGDRIAQLLIQRGGGRGTGPDQSRHGRSRIHRRTRPPDLTGVGDVG